MAKRKKILAEDVVEEKAPVVSPDEQELLSRLFEYTQVKAIPWQKDYENTLKECYQFKERKQWESADMQALAKGDVPVISVDRIGRSLDTINGIRTNTGTKKKVVKREMGDDRVATILDKVADFDDYNGDFASPRDEAFNAMLDCGMGLRVIGYDPTEMGGEGMIVSEFLPTEDAGWSRCKKKNLEDIVWGWYRVMKNWEEAILIAPDKAPQLKSLKTTLETKWEEIKSGNVQSNYLTKDYGAEANSHSEGKYEYANQLYIYVFWQKKNIPIKKIGSLKVADEFGVPLPVPIPQVRKEPLEYEAVEGEQVLATTVEVQWCQYVVASGRGQTSSILLKESITDDHPFIGECADRFKSGAPDGFIAKVIDHQKRVNIAWAQKTAYNNKSIKSPLITKGGKLDLQTAVQQSSFGALLHLDQNTELVQVNTQPQVNLQALEEGNLARQDMDFTAAASEPVMTGQTGQTKSGIQLSMQQNAAITPLNKWIKAEQDAELLFWRKWLKLAIRYYKPERMARIIGIQEFMKLIGTQFDEYGMPTEPPLQILEGMGIEKYDVQIQDQSISDFNKQQTFNAVMAMRDGGIIFEDSFVIQNAPIKNVDEALASNQKARNDLIMFLKQQVMMLQEQMGQMEKMIPKESSNGQPNRKKSQPANAQQGKNASQSGRRSMVGGQLGMPG